MDLKKRVILYCAILFINILGLVTFIILYMSDLYKDFTSVSLEIEVMEEKAGLMKKNLANYEYNLDELQKSDDQSCIRSIALNNEPEALFYLANLPREYGLVCENFKILERNMEESIIKRPVEMTVVGKYLDTMDFLAYIQQGEYYFIPEMVSFDVTRVINEGDVALALNISLLLEEELEEQEIDNKPQTDEKRKRENPFYYRQ